MKKTCSKCWMLKDIEKFARASNKRDDRQSWCKKCCNAYYRKYYPSHKCERNSYFAKWQKERAKDLQLKRHEYLAGKCCADCGTTERLRFMRGGREHISHMIHNATKWEKILEAMENSEIVCIRCVMKRNIQQLKRETDGKYVRS